MAVWQSFGKINYFIKKGKRKMREEIMEILTELRPDVESYITEFFRVSFCQPGGIFSVV